MSDMGHLPHVQCCIPTNSRMLARTEAGRLAAPIIDMEPCKEGDFSLLHTTHGYA